MCNTEDSRLLTQHTTAANRILTETDKTNRAIGFIRSYSYHTCTRLSTSMSTANYRPTNSTSFLQLRCRGLLNQPSFRCRPPPCRLGIPKRVSAGKEPLLQGHSSQLTLTYCAPNPYSFEGLQGVLEQIAETLPGINVKTEVS